MLIEIAKKDRCHRFEASAGEKLLFAGLRAGIPLPYECATGTCGSCRARLKSGHLEQGWLQAPGRKNFKAGRGEFLMCQAIAQSDCRVGVLPEIQPFRDDDLCPEHYRGAVSSRSWLTVDVLHFDVKLPVPVRFHAGQFFVLRAPTVDGYRAYSMVNYSPQTDRLEFIIKRKSGGAFSEWMFDRDQTNTPLDVFGPLGRATFHEDESCNLFLIAGGSGIAGLMSILEHASSLDYLRNHKATLFFGVRTWNDVFFLDRLIAMCERFADNFTAHIVVSEPHLGAGRPSFVKSLSTAHGLVHEVAVKALPAPVANTMVYVAGPQPMVDASLRSLVIESKISPQSIRYDQFT